MSGRAWSDGATSPSPPATVLSVRTPAAPPALTLELARVLLRLVREADERAGRKGEP